MKIAFFVQRGLDSFLNTVIDQLSKEHETRKIIISNQNEIKLIDKWMDWSDICWFEWCDSLIVYASKLPIANEKRIICRLHSYEAFTAFPAKVNWDAVDKLIVISRGIYEYITAVTKINKEKICIIPNGIDLDKLSFRDRKPGHKIAYVGYINYKKGPMLLLHTFKAIHDIDDKYELYIAGKYQDERYRLYFRQMAHEFGLENSICYQGWQNDLNGWLEDKDYILCSSLLESQNISVMQAMAKGIKPVIHNFVGATDIYPAKYLWNSIDDAAKQVTAAEYVSEEYRKYIKENYSLEAAISKIKKLLASLSSERKTVKGFDYKNYWNRRLAAKFDITSVGYQKLGEIYNTFLYRNRLDIVSGVLNKSVSGIDGKKVLELGPGTGIFTDMFLSFHVKEYCGIDVSEKSVRELSKKFSDYRFICGDVSDDGLITQKYDIILAASVLMHITDEECYKNAVKNISEHLSDDGLCLILDSISQTDYVTESQHLVVRKKDYVKTILDENGLYIADILPITNFLNYPYDKDLAGKSGMYAYQAFGMIDSLFSGNVLTDGEKMILGEYLLFREKRLLCQDKPALSEKLLLIRKKGSPSEAKLHMRELIDIEFVNKRLNELTKFVDEKELAHSKLIRELKDMIDNLEKSEAFKNDPA